MAKGQWLRLELGVYQSAKVRLARAGALWPWVLVQLKREGSGGRVPVVNLHPELAAADLHLPVDICEAQIKNLIGAGLLIIQDGMYSTPNWSDYQIDGRPTSKRRKPRKSADESENRSPGIPTLTNTSTNTNTSPPPTVPGVPELVDPPVAEQLVGGREEVQTRLIDGVEHYTAATVLVLLRETWPDQDPMASALMRCATEISGKYTRAEIDEGLASDTVKTGRTLKPFGFKIVLERQRRHGTKPRRGAAKEASASAMKAEAAKVKPNDSELLLLADELAAVNVKPDAELLPEILRVLEAHGKVAPEGWN